MSAIGKLVEEHKPDVIFFQEITPYIHCIFESFAWWKDYHCSPVPQDQPEKQHFCLMLTKLPMKNYGRWRFAATATDRDYLAADINPGWKTANPIHIATTQLERPSQPGARHHRDRYAQAKHAIAALSREDNVVFGGDMSWDDDADLPFPLPAGGVDAWKTLRPREYHECSWTCNSFWNEKVGEINGCKADYASLQKRSDRFVCKLQDYTLRSIELIGDQSVGFNYKGDGKLCWMVPLMSSCHRGALLTIVSNEQAQQEAKAKAKANLVLDVRHGNWPMLLGEVQFQLS